MIPIDRELSKFNYRQARADQERAAADHATDERCRRIHLNLATTYEICLLLECSLDSDLPLDLSGDE